MLKRVQELQSAFKGQKHSESICFISHGKHRKHRNLKAHTDLTDFLCPAEIVEIAEMYIFEHFNGLNGLFM